MYTLKTEYHFDSAHFLSGYDGKCSNIHGHRWKVEVTCVAGSLIQSGQERDMVMDFGNVKKVLKDICTYFDHCLIYEVGTLSENFEKELKLANFRTVTVKGRPTSENLAKIIFDMMSEKGIEAKSVTVYETPQNFASYSKK